MNRTTKLTAIVVLGLMGVAAYGHDWHVPHEHYTDGSYQYDSDVGQLYDLMEQYYGDAVKHNQKYRIVWHEFVALTINHHRERYEVMENDTIWIRYREVCDTVGFRPTVIEHILIEDSL